MTATGGWPNMMKEKFTLQKIENYIKTLKDIEVLVLGDTILDHYVFVAPRGRAIKDPILSVKYRSDEIYPGGILAVANHVSDFVKKIKLVTLIGDQKNKLDFIKGSIKSNTELKTFVKRDSPTTVKKRMVDFYRKHKLFKVEYINDRPIDNVLTEEIVSYLDDELPKYDVVIVGDFGHGFLNEAIRRKIEEKSRFLALNVQSNSSNMGYNYFNLYKRFDFINMNEGELRLPLFKRFEDIDQVMKEAYSAFKFDTFLVTHGKDGCTFVNKGRFFKASAVVESVKDTVGAGDALFAIAALFVYLKADNELIPIIANCAGGIAANIMGNKESITKDKLLDFLNDTFGNRDHEQDIKAV